MAATAERLTQAWETRPGLSFALTSVDHKQIGARYLYTSFTFFVIGGIEALLMRIQLARPENHFLNEHAYDQLFTLHGTTMIFLFATPIIVGGFGNYLVPLMLGTRDMAFPRLNALSYWIYLAAGILMYASFLTGTPPNGGWFNYVPLTGSGYTPGPNIDYYALGIIFLSISTTAGAINFLCTVLKMRAPGMSVNRLPLFIWSLLTTAFVIVFAFPALTLACMLLELDRKFGTNFYNPAAGGDPLLWQHLFWIFGHPEVYIVFLPAVGIVSTILPVFCRRPPVGYTALALSSVAIGFLSFGVWAHHMFAVGLPAVSTAFFSAASMMITIPSGVQMFAWLLTVWKGRPVWKTPFLYILGFVAIFMAGGITGVMVAAVPFDRQVTDSYFIVAHLHYVLLGGMLFPIFAALYYWTPKITGRILDERLGQLGFWLNFIGFNLTFFPMHITGLLGMPRRVYTYQAGLGWGALNMLETIGAFVLASGMAVFIISFKRGEPAGDDPWHADTLEWAVSSPPPAYNFATIPTVRGRHPLWEQSREDLFRSTNGGAGIAGTPAGGILHETAGTSILDAIPDATLHMPEDTYLPLILAVGLFIFFAGFLPSVHAAQIFIVGVGAVITACTIVAWLAPEKTASANVDEATQAQPAGVVRRLMNGFGSPRTGSAEVTLPAELSGAEAPGWWGMALLITTELTLFTLLLPVIATIVLLSSSGPMIWAESGIKQGNQSALRLGLLLSFVLGAAFVGLQAYEYSTEKFGLSTNAYGSLFFTITGIHGLHVIGGLCMNLVVQYRSWRGDFNARRHLAVQNAALYWHFVDVVWIAIFTSLYISPHLHG